MTFTTDGSACIRFPITQALYDRFAPTNPDLFELISSSPFSAHLVMWCSPEDYKPIDQELGSTDISPGYSTMVITPVAKLYGFEISTVESRPAVYDTLNALRRASTQTPGIHRAIALLDGHHIHDGDAIQTIHGHPYSVRNMRLQSLTPQGGSILVNGQRYAVNGFTVRLLEVSPRDVY